MSFSLALISKGFVLVKKISCVLHLRFLCPSLHCNLGFGVVVLFIKSVKIRQTLMGGSLFCLQVWDVPKGEPLYNFRGHSGRVMCVVWSYLDPDLVYSGGEDGTVRPWRPSMQEHPQPPVQGLCPVVWLV